jgi:6-phosphogluconolactonase
MKRKMLTLLGIWPLVIISCAASSAQADKQKEATVWTMSNDPAGNAVLAFNLVDGQFSAVGAFPTGGLGTGGKEPDFGLGNAHPLQLNEDGRLMFVVNPGSNDISLFAVRENSLMLLDRVGSGGKQPLSVTAHGDLVYVLNAGGNVGGADNIAGFRVVYGTKLSPLRNSTRPLSTAATHPAQIQFSPNGKVLVVTEKNTNIIDTYTVGRDGRATGPIVTPADAQTPFGFYVENRNQLFISDDFNDAVGKGAMSTYTIADNGVLHLVSSAVPAHESGACWVVVDKDGRFALLANTVSSAISVYSVNRQNGSVKFFHSFPSPFAPTDLDFSQDGRFFFAVATDQNLKGSPGVLAYRFNPEDGSVAFLSSVRNLPRSIDGLIAR